MRETYESEANPSTKTAKDSLSCLKRPSVQRSRSHNVKREGNVPHRRRNAYSSGSTLLQDTSTTLRRLNRPHLHTEPARDVPGIPSSFKSRSGDEDEGSGGEEWVLARTGGDGEPVGVERLRRASSNSEGPK